MKFIKVEVFTPIYNVKEIIDILNENEILKFGNYDNVYSKGEVLGYFRPLEGANPTEGRIGEVTEIRESKIEFRINYEDKDRAYDLIRQAHVYEEPVINMMELL